MGLASWFGNRSGTVDERLDRLAERVRTLELERAEREADLLNLTDKLHYALRRLRKRVKDAATEAEQEDGALPEAVALRRARASWTPGSSA